jgi:DNA-directed RNA polymerase subunit RPC12/RpoP
MMIACPECARQVSDRAAACPECGFPIREWVEQERERLEAKKAIESRKQVGEVDCPPCGARGFVVFDEKEHGRSGFTWCPICGHSGRVALCESSDGFHAVSWTQLAGFLAGSLHPGDPGVDFLGKRRPEGFKYPQAGTRHEYTTIPPWFVALLPRLIT